MFCPKCGALMSVQVRLGETSELCCTQGEMCLSPDMQRRLEQRFAPELAGTPMSPQPAYNRQLHGGLGWYCPGDGTRLNDQLECPQCGKHIRDLVWALIELHPHRPVTREPAS